MLLFTPTEKIMFCCLIPTYFFIQSLVVTQAITHTSREEEVGEESEYYTNAWVIRALGGINKVKLVATQFGFDSNVEILDGLPHVYLLRNSKYPEKMNDAEEDLTRRLREKSEVDWVEQQIALKLIPTIQFPSIDNIPFSKQIRSIFSWNDSSESDSTHFDIRTIDTCARLNDEYWPQQYYIQDCRDKNVDKPPRDLNVVPVWFKHHIFGKNVKVIVIDDGVETHHSDLVDNYDPSLGLDLQDNDTEPDPVHFWWHKFSHGTRCAGIIGMKANNTMCGAGIAPEVTLGAVRLVGPKLLSEFEIIKALLFKYDEVDIISNSWSMRDNGKSVWLNGLLSLSAIKAGIVKGRKGKGVIYVFACGTRKSQGENCGRDALRNCIYTISVASCDSHGKITFFSERCASIMVTTYSGAGFPFRNNVVSTDVGNGCTANHSGTSASAPMVSGAMALLLEANSNLTWRDVQHLLAWTSKIGPLQKNPPGTWTKNAAGFYVSHDFGFGLLDVNDLVEKAKDFQNVPPMNTCVTEGKLWKSKSHFRSGLKVEIVADGCKGSPAEVRYLEHVQVTLSLTYPKRGDLRFELISPAGTESILLEPRPFDAYALGIPAWTFASIRTWGENPTGRWIFRVTSKSHRSSLGSVMKTVWSTLKNATRLANEGTRDAVDDEYLNDAIYPGKLNRIHLIFYGTSGKGKPQHYEAGPRTYDDVSHLPTG